MSSSDRNLTCAGGLQWCCAVRGGGGNGGGYLWGVLLRCVAVWLCRRKVSRTSRAYASSLTHCPTTMAHRCEHRPQISAPLLLLVLCRSKHNADRTGWLWLWPPSGTRRVEMQHAPVIISPSPLSCSWRLAETRRYFYSRLCRAAWTRTPT